MPDRLNQERQFMAVRVAGVSLDTLRHLSTEEFRQFGLPTLAYLRTDTSRGGNPHYAIHAADGSVMAEADELDLVLEDAAEEAIVLVVTQ